MSADTFQIKRGTTAKVAAYTPADGEIVLDTTTKRLVVGDGSTVGGVNPRVERKADYRDFRTGPTDAVTTVSVGDYIRMTNNGVGPGYGYRQDYIHTGTLASGFSLGIGNVCLWQNITGGASGQAMWTVATTPTLAAGGSWGVVCEELNIMNRGPDNGYKKTRGESARWAGGIQMVPEADDLAGGTGNICRNTTFGFCTAHSSHVNDLGFQVKTYNGLLIEKDSIGPAGRGVLASGDSTGVGSQLPQYAMEIDQRWNQGINTTLATFTANLAINLADNHVITWGAAGTGPQIFGNQTSGNLRVASSGAGAIQMNPGGAAAMQFAPVASTVNLFSVNGNIAGQSPAMVVAGTDADINFIVAAKGTGRFQINTGDMAVNTVGKGLRVKEGANGKQGVATLVAGSVVVANTSVTATSRIFLTGQQDGGTPGWVRVSARAAGTSFTITSSSGTDTSVIAYQIYEPA